MNGNFALPSRGAEIAKYFFHLHDGAFVPDGVGAEFADWREAADYALERAREAVNTRGAAFWKGEHMRIVVTDSIGTALFELRLSGHLPLEPNVAGPHETSSLN